MKFFTQLFAFLGILFIGLIFIAIPVLFGLSFGFSWDDGFKILFGAGCFAEWVIIMIFASDKVDKEAET